MSAYFFPIQTALIFIIVLVLFLLIPWLIISYRKYGYFSLWSSVFVFSFIFYSLSAYFLVILPLPMTRDTCSLQVGEVVHYQLLPFYFVWDIFKDASIQLSQPSTYINIFRQGAFLPAAFNFLLLFPLGVYMSYFFSDRSYWKRALFIGFAVSLFFEVTQITGLYGLYNCPYRMFNVDDLLLNSLGSLTGFLLGPAILSFFPRREDLLSKRDQVFTSGRVRPFAQLLSLFIDFFLVGISWNLFASFLPDSYGLEIFFKSLAFLFFFVCLPLFWEGKTIGTALLRFTLRARDHKKGISYLRRFLSLYFVWLLFKLFGLLNENLPDIDSSYYEIYLYVDLLVFLFVLGITFLLLIHGVYVLWKRGEKAFYFHQISGIYPEYVKKKKKD